jgi:hypothetical protein
VPCGEPGFGGLGDWAIVAVLSGELEEDLIGGPFLAPAPKDMGAFAEKGFPETKDRMALVIVG